MESKLFNSYNANIEERDKQKLINVHLLLQSKSFSRQMEDLCQQLLKKTSIFSADEAQDVILSLIQTLVLIEKHLMNTQEADLKVMCCDFLIYSPYSKKKLNQS